MNKTEKKTDDYKTNGLATNSMSWESNYNKYDS